MKNFGNSLITKISATSEHDSYQSLMKTFAIKRIRAANKRTPPSRDIFTAFYSTILATAAVVDSRAKEERLREWDRAIAEAREGLLTGEDISAQGGHKEQGLKPTQPIHSLGADTCNGKNKRPDRNVFWQPSTRLLRKKITREPSPQSSTSYPNLENYQQIGFPFRQTSETETFRHEQPDPDAPERYIVDPIELEHLQKNVNGLVTRLLASSTFYWSSSTAVEKEIDPDTQRQLEIMKQRLKSLELSFSQLPLYKSDEDLEVVKRQAKELNVILWSICRKARAEESSLNLMIAKICYNLLISATPPNIETYNILLRQLLLLDRYDLVGDVLDSFWPSQLRPNKITIQLIILYYKATKDKDGLNQIVKQMRGASGDLMLSSQYAKDYRLQWPSVERHEQGLKGFNPDDPVIRKQMRKHKLFYRFGYLYTKSTRDKHVFDALITAHLELKGLRPAARCIAAAIREGVVVKSRTLCDIIDQAIRRVDFTTGLKLLMVILSQWKTSGRTSCFPFNQIVRYQIRRLLIFCGIDVTLGENGHLPRRIKIYTEAMILQEMEYPKDALRKMLTYMEVMSIEDSLNRHSILIESIRRDLAISGLSPSLTAGVKRALLSLKNAAEAEKKAQAAELITNQSSRGKDLEISGLEANNITSFSKSEEIATGLAMIRVKRCALKLNELAHFALHDKDSRNKQEHLENLSIHLGILHMQLKLEIHLNIWWIRRLGILASTFRSSVQRKRLNFIVKNLNILESKVNHAWDEFTTSSRFNP